jgi:NAD+ kinase
MLTIVSTFAIQLKLRGQAPKALRWKRLEQRYKAHKQCVTDLLSILRKHGVNFSCVNRVELDRQHLADVDLMVAVGGDGTVLSAAHFLDHGTIPLLGINSDPNVSHEDRSVTKNMDERKSHGALCMCTARDMDGQLAAVLSGGGHVQLRTRLRCTVKSTFSETRLVPALNDLLLANPSPAAVSRFRMGWLQPSKPAAVPPQSPSLFDHSTSVPIPVVPTPSDTYGTVTRFGGKAYDVTRSINVWSSGMWVCTATGSTAAMAAAGGQPMDTDSTDIQYLIREHMIERLPQPLSALPCAEQEESSRSNAASDEALLTDTINNRMVTGDEKLHVRWNSQRGRIFIDGSHLTHNLELGDEIMIDNKAPPLHMFTRVQNL